MVGFAALASIPESYLSKDDAMVRMNKRPAEDGEDEESDETPKPKKAKVAASDDAKTPAKEKPEAGGASLKLFIKGLPYSVDEAALRKDFAECGEIKELQL